MGVLPTSLGTRPRLALEIRPEGVVAARSEDAEALVTATAHGTFAGGTLTPGLRVGNFGARAQALAAVKKALETVALKERQTTLVVPDAAMRVLLLDFDALPSKSEEALQVVRFRLKKLLPFDADDAVVSYQVMSTQRGLIRVLAVAVPCAVLAEYESLVREAGFEPGAVLPSTLAACAGLPEDTSATLLVNAGETGVTTAIVQGGVLLLHRTVDLAAEGLEEKIAVAVAAGDVAWGAPPAIPEELLALPLVDADATAGEWARQPPVHGYGVLDDTHVAEAERAREREAASLAGQIVAEAEDLVLEEQALEEQALEEQALEEQARAGMLPVPRPEPERSVSAAAREITQAVSVAAAYFEDTLAEAPGVVHSAGPLGANALSELLREAGFGQAEIRVLEAVDPAMLAGGASTGRVPRSWLAGVRGALRS